MKARIDAKGLFSCFAPGLTDDDGEAVNAEISAVVWNGTHLVFGSDKHVPGTNRSQVFALAVKDGVPQPDTLDHYTAELICTAEKYEDFALTDDGRHLVATTGFDRVQPDSAEQDVYNRLLIWPCNAPEEVALIADRQNDGVSSSVGLRDDLSAALGARYFKIEGLASLPPGGDCDQPRLLFGIRELGESHEDFDYVAQVVAAPYRMGKEGFEFTGAFEKLYAFDPQAFDGVRYKVGLSSLEYDPPRERLYFLTSFEVEDSDEGEVIGAYLWSVPQADFLAGKPPTLVGNHDGSTLEFRNKAEGVAVLEDGRLFVVYDPDRQMTLDDGHARDRREPHEAPYTLLSILDG